MAIKVSGTTVINDSRELNNITSVDATTVAALGAAGVGGGGGIELTTSEAVVEGDTLSFNFDTGKVEKTGRVGGNGYNSLGSLSTNRTGRIAHISGDVFAVNYGDSSGNTNKLAIVRWNPSTNSFTVGSTHTFSTNSSMALGSVVLYSSATNKVIFFAPYYFQTNYRLQVMAYTPDTTNLTLTASGSEEVDYGISWGSENTLSATLDSTETKAFVMYRGDGSYSPVGAYGMGRLISIGASGTNTLTVHSATGPNSSTYFVNQHGHDFDQHSVISDGNQIIAVYYTANDMRAAAGTLSGTSITWGSSTVIGGVTHTYYSHGNLFKHVSGKYGAFVMNGSTQPAIIQFDVSSSNVISNNSMNNVSFNANSSYPVYTSYDSTNNLLYYGSRNSSTTHVGDVELATTAPYELNIRNANILSNGTSVVSASYNPDAEYAFYGLYGSNSFGYYAPQIDNYLDFIGVAKEAASANSTVKIANAGQIATGLSGLTAGNAYRINYDGGWQNLGMNAARVNFNYAQRDRVSGRALTSTTMLMMNDFMSS